MTGPVDATSTSAWAALAAHHDKLEPDLRGWFAADPDRTANLTLDAGDLHVDLSKNLITAETLPLLLQLADEVGLTDRRDAMFAGEHINVTEDRAVLHTALRRPSDASPKLVVDGQDIDTEVHAVLRKVYDFAVKVRDGDWVGVTGKRIQTIVNIGIGGSDLGPVMAYEALKPYVADGLECRFISNIDGRDRAGARPGHHAVHRRVQDVRHAGDADQRPAGPGVALVNAPAGRRDRRRRRVP
jgi:glucose-6-phosphate isomerase